MPMYNLIEYSNNYFETSESLWQVKRVEIATNSNVCNVNSFSLNTNQVLLVI